LKDFFKESEANFLRKELIRWIRQKMENRLWKRKVILEKSNINRTHLPS
jgi:hypothetical protein